MCTTHTRLLACLRAPESSVRKARCLYTRIIPGGVTGSERREGANGVGGGNGDGNGDRDGNGAGTGTRVEANKGA